MDSLKTFLDKYNISELEETLLTEDIAYETLIKLTQEEIKELFPLLKQRALLRDAIQQEKQETNVIVVISNDAHHDVEVNSHLKISKRRQLRDDVKEGYLEMWKSFGQIKPWPALLEKILVKNFKMTNMSC